MKHLPGFRYWKWKRSILVFVLQLCAVCLFAQVRISGKVTDAENKGIPGISVTIRNTSFGGATDVNGLYLITADLRAGTYTIEFSGVGYKITTQSLQVGSSVSYTINV